MPMNVRTPFVLATGTTPAKAMQAQQAVAMVLETPQLRAPIADKWHYGPSDEWGFHYIELDTEDAIEGPVAQTLDAFHERVRAQAAFPGARFVEPVSLVLVGVAGYGAALVAGAGQEAGRDLHQGLKRRRAQGILRGSSEHQEESRGGNDLARLFDQLGLVYTEGGILDGIVLLRVLNPDVTFLIEPGLPAAAKREATRLVLNPDRLDRAGTPLRWRPRRKRWRHLPGNWANEDQLATLRPEADPGREEQ